MRYYNIVITNQEGIIVPIKSLQGLGLTSLLPSGVQNPIGGQINIAALNVEFDISVVGADVPSTNCWLRIWGVGLVDISNSSDFNGMNIQVYGGMSTGLPLANPAQAGLLVQGFIYQSFGNWQGRDQYLDFMIVPGGNGIGSANLPQNYPFTWKKGTTLASALTNTFSIALPNLTPDIQISPNLVLAHDEVGHYQSLAQLGKDVRALSKSIIGGNNYDGVSIAVVGRTLRVRDNTTPTPATIQILPQDIIGQPVWLGPNTINVQTVMRADISMNDIIVLPSTIFASNPQSLRGIAAGTKQTFTFQGSFLVGMVRHIGNFRQADAASWTSTFQCYYQNSGNFAP